MMFHRFDDEGGIVELEPELRGKDTVSDPADVIRSSARLFEPLVDRPTWDAVQKKLRGRFVTWLDDILCSASSPESVDRAVGEVQALLRQHNGNT